MNRYDADQPIEPFYVPAKVLKCSAVREETAGSAAGGGDQGKKGPQWMELDTFTGKAVGGLVFAAAYFLVQRNPVFGAVTVFILLGAALFRLDERRRRIAIAPLFLATVRLASQMSSSFTWSQNRSLIRDAFPAVPFWLPLFLAACLFFGPNLRTVTETITMTFSMMLLLAGLIPGDGYVVMFAMLQYMLFVAIAVGLTIDLVKHAPMTGTAPLQR